MSSSTEHFEITSVVRGYHVYRDIWEATERERLQCARELTNRHDPYAIAIVKNGETVGHVPRLISAVCSLFLRRGGSIQCTVTGSRKYSEDLPQGGLEIPCLYTFRAPTGNKDNELLDKTQTLIRKVYSTASSELRQNLSANLIPPAPEPATSPKKRKLEDLHPKQIEPSTTAGEMDKVWVNGLPGNIVLTQRERKTLVDGDELTDMHINAYQGLLKATFPHVKGLYSTLAPPSVQGGWIDSYVQILHCNGNHWIMASTIGCDVGEVYIYDSLYRNITDETKYTLNKIFTATPIKYYLPAVPTQKGVKDCGVFAIAFTSYLAHGNDPSLLGSQYHIDQDSLRPTLLSIFETKLISDFPFIKIN